LHQMDGFDEGLIVPNWVPSIAPNGWVWWRFDCAKLGAFNCTKWMGLMKVWLCQIGCLQLHQMDGFDEGLIVSNWVPSLKVLGFLIVPNGWVWWKVDHTKFGYLQWKFWLCLMGGFNENLDCTKWVGYFLKSFANVQRIWQVFIWNLSLYRHEHTLQDQIGKMFSQDWQLLIMKSESVSHMLHLVWVGTHWLVYMMSKDLVWKALTYTKWMSFGPSFDHNFFLQVCSIVGQWHWQRN
jgi:hypothetical protein